MVFRMAEENKTGATGCLYIQNMLMLVTEKSWYHHGEKYTIEVTIKSVQSFYTQDSEV